MENVSAESLKELADTAMNGLAKATTTPLALIMFATAALYYDKSDVEVLGLPLSLPVAAFFLPFVMSAVWMYNIRCLNAILYALRQSNSSLSIQHSVTSHLWLLNPFFNTTHDMGDWIYETAWLPIGATILIGSLGNIFALWWLGLSSKVFSVGDGSVVSFAVAVLVIPTWCSSWIAHQYFVVKISQVAACLGGTVYRLRRRVLIASLLASDVVTAAVLYAASH